MDPVTDMAGKTGSVGVLGVRIDRVNLDQSADLILQMVLRGDPGYVVTPNAEMVWRAVKSPRFREVLNAAALSVPDGRGVMWASRVLTDAGIVSQVAGVELMEQLMKVAGASSVPVYLLGSSTDVLKKACLKFRERYSADIRGYHHGFFTADEEEGVAADIERSGAKLCLVGMGVPRQEQWMSRHALRLGVVAIGVGGALEVAAGVRKRAPVLFRELGLEWLYRIVREPRRMMRAGALPMFTVAVLFERLRRRER